MYGVTLFFAVHSPMSRYCSITFSHCTIVRQRLFFIKCGQYCNRIYWNYVPGMNDHMTVYSWYIIWMNEVKQSLWMRYLHWCVFPCIPMIWRHDKVVRQRRSGATSRHSCIATQCGDTTSCIRFRHSTSSKETVHIVRGLGLGLWSTRRKPPTCRMSLTNLFTQCCIEYTSSERGSNSQY
jgi:hypothetical protein